MDNFMPIIDSLKGYSYLSKSCGHNHRNMVRGFGRFFIFKEFNMNEIITDNVNWMTSKEIAEVLNVSKMTVRSTIAKLGIKVLLYRNVNNNKTECFNEEQVTLIKQEIQKHHNLQSRQIDSVSTQLEENEIIANAIMILKRRTVELENKLKSVENKNNLLMHSEKSYTITEIAKELGYNSAIEFNKLLHEDEIIFKQNGTWVPYSQYSKCGYFEIKQSILENEIVVYNLRVTQKGREFLLSRYSNKLF